MALNDKIAILRDFHYARLSSRRLELPSYLVSVLRNSNGRRLDVACAALSLIADCRTLHFQVLQHLRLRPGKGSVEPTLLKLIADANSDGLRIRATILDDLYRRLLRRPPPQPRA
jgi:hypothetical protein